MAWAIFPIAGMAWTGHRGTPFCSAQGKEGTEKGWLKTGGVGIGEETAELGET